MSVSELSPVKVQQGAEHQFYSLYHWCLNPFLTMEELFRKLHEELDRYHALTVDWQREESLINLYLFICAIDCTIDDFLSARKWKLYFLKKMYPRLRWPLGTAEWLLNLPFRLSRRRSAASAVRGKNLSDRCVEQVCAMLAEKSLPSEQRITELKESVDRLSGFSFPRALMSQRMKLNEGFRCQDLTHHDVFLMIEKVLAAGIKPNAPIAVLGLRTAGVYFAPLAAAYLSQFLSTAVSWGTIRPKAGLTPDERTMLKRWKSASAQIIVIDDYPNSGDSLLLTSSALLSCGIRASSTTFVVPKHSFETNWLATVHRKTRARIVVLEHDEIYKKRGVHYLVQEDILREYFGGGDNNTFSVVKDPETTQTNAHLSLHESDGFQVRLKRVYDVRSSHDGAKGEVHRVLAKSVGWGWLGYHAFIIANRMSGFVPKCLGLRKGMLYTEWVEGETPVVSSKKSAEMADRIGGYIAARVNRLYLAEDPRSTGTEYGWGWMELLAIVRRVYGFYLGRILDRKLLSMLVAFKPRIPACIDGRMRLEDWIETERGALKTDFEQHNFGAPEMDIVDAAYDLAGGIFEFNMDKKDESILLESYTRSCNDPLIRDRLLLYKLLYGTVAARQAVERAQKTDSRQGRERANGRFLKARTFLAKTMSEFAGTALPVNIPSEWSTRLFFMDVDGIFDREVLGFPHTTMRGLKALAALQMNGYSVLLNTGRSVEHVRNYCRAYNLQGGIAEYGSVFVDNVRGRELPIIESKGFTQLERCREAIKELRDVFADDEYRYSVRLYRFEGRDTVGLSAQEVNDFLGRHGFDGLTAIFRKPDTYIVQRNIGKGSGIRFMKNYLNDANLSISAIGDSDEDISMLRRAGRSFVPRNGSATLKRAARFNHWPILPDRFQKALLGAVMDVIPLQSISEINYLSTPDDKHPVAKMLFHLLDVADQPKLKKLTFA